MLGKATSMPGFLDKLREEVQAITADDRRERVQSVQVEFTCESMLDWLVLQDNDTKIYWRGKDGAFESAGIGCVHMQQCELRSVDALLDKLDMANGIHRYYSAIEFNGHCHFVLPRFEISRTHERTQFICNIAPGDSLDTVSGELNTLKWTADIDATLPAVTGKQSFPDRAGWIEKVNRALTLIYEGTLDKVVLARAVQLEFDGDLDASAIMHTLGPMASTSYAFLFQTSSSKAFLGISPERFYARTGRTFRTEAVAGTRPRSSSVEQDDAFAEELVASDKELREHAIVARSIHDSLKDMCMLEDDTSAPVIMKLKHVQHLATRFHAQLHDDVTDAALLRALHPTPAVGGFPQAEASRTIADLEPFARGFYAGPVGWVAGDAAEFAVAIRSGMVDGNTLTLYSGAGIVAGSDPEEEWAELDSKLETFLGVLGCNEE